MHAFSSIVDPNPDRVGSSSFCQIRIGRIWIGTNSKQMIKLINFTFWKKVISGNFHYAVQKTEDYGIFDTDEKDKTFYTGNAVTKSKKILIFHHL